MVGHMFTILPPTEITAPLPEKENNLVSFKLRTIPTSCHKPKEYYPEIIYNKQKNLYPIKNRHWELAAYEHCKVSQAKIGGNSERTRKFLLGWGGMTVWECTGGRKPPHLSSYTEDEATKPEGPGGDCRHTMADGGPLG